MSKKHDTTHGGQGQDKQAGKHAKGDAADQAGRGHAKGHPPNHLEPGVGKVDNDRNKVSEDGATTQTNQGQRSPQSRNDRESRIGSHNVVEATSGGKGTGRGPRGAG